MIQRPLAAVAVLTTVLVLAACGGGESVKQSESSPSIAAQTTTGSAAKSDKMTGPATADREVYDFKGFISPSGNVACMIDPSFVRCDIIDNDWSPPPHPADCEFDYGQGISLTAGGPAEFVCAGDTAFGPDAVLAYGDSIDAGVLKCESAESGFTCRDAETGHGFSISREAYQLF